MPAGACDWTAGHDKPGGLDQAEPDGFHQVEGDRTACPGIDDGRHAGEQVGASTGGRLHQQDAVVALQGRREWHTGAVHCQVRVGVNQSW